jgi:hypothetical protein
VQNMASKSKAGGELSSLQQPDAEHMLGCEVRIPVPQTGEQELRELDDDLAPPADVPLGLLPSIIHMAHLMDQTSQVAWCWGVGIRLDHRQVFLFFFCFFLQVLFR